MKVNNKGFSLIEVMLAVLISTIVFGTVTALIVYASNNVRLTNARVSLQDEAKDAMNHLESYCLEAESASWDDAESRLILFTDEEDAKKVSDGTVKIDEIYSLTSDTYVYWFKGNCLYFGKCSSTKSTEPLIDLVNLPEDDMNLLADSVQDFEASVVKNTKSGKYVIDLNMDFYNDAADYQCSKRVYCRNQ